jgi:threonylcarbamoyladenosine tRNA methylthiotransferase MtaB
MKTARKVAETDTREIVLTGVNIGDFGKGSKETFYALIQQLDTLERIDRIRISSVEPNLLTNQIIEFCAQSEKFMPHFHVPLQSGSNKILKKMKRRYDREYYEDRVKRIKSNVPDACIGADVIVGFPGETEGDFLETYNFLNELNISYLHVFTYSERSNTGAVEMGERVSKETKADRSKMLHILSDKKQRYFHDQFINKNRPVLFENIKNGKIIGHTDNYIKVQVEGGTSLINTIQPVMMKENHTSLVSGILD